MNAADKDKDYCEPLFLPGQWVLDRKTGKVHRLRVVLPFALEDTVYTYLYVAETGAWQGDELIAAPDLDMTTRPSD